jgi:hypothetical protein
MPNYITNGQWRDFVYRSDVPAKILSQQFDHLEEENSFDGFFCYRGHWYHLSDFMRSETNMFGDAPFKVDGYASDSYFSGVVIRISRDGEQYKVATYLS